MIIWLTIFIFQTMFDVKISGESLLFLQMFAFVELMVEISLLIFGILYLVRNQLINKEND